MLYIILYMYKNDIVYKLYFFTILYYLYISYKKRNETEKEKK